MPVKAQKLDAWMRRPQAGLILAGISVGLWLLYLMARPSLSGTGLGSRLGALLAPVPLIGAVILALSSWLDVTVWRRLWRSGRDRVERCIYDRGVREFGVLLTLFAMIAFPVERFVLTPEGEPPPALIPMLGFALFVCLIGGGWLFLGAGYQLGRWLASQMAMTRAESLRRPDLPPPVSEVQDTQTVPARSS
jgi:hypothetical protein